MGVCNLCQQTVWIIYEETTNYRKQKRFHKKLTLREVSFLLIFFKITKINEKEESNFTHGYISKSFSMFLMNNCNQICQ